MEKWMLIPNFEDYAISNLGNIKNVKTDIITKKHINNDGYYEVFLSKNGIKKCFKLHKLMALIFLENPKEKPYVWHIDGKKTNNCLNNLKWGNFPEVYEFKNKFIKATDTNFNKVYIFDSVGEASRFLNLNKQFISRALKQRNGYYHAYMFEYYKKTNNI